MSSIDRSLSGDVLVFDLAAMRADLAAAPAVANGGRQARTLLKEGRLRVTLITIGPGGAIPEHRADGPITVHVLDGRMSFDVAGATHELTAGQLLSAPADVPHSVRSDEGATFLLTMSLPERGGGE